MTGLTVTLPSYSIGNDVFKDIEKVCLQYGSKVLVVGGQTAIEKTKDKLKLILENSTLEIIDFIWYGGECTYENMDKISKIALESNVHMIFGLGGGKAIDTAKGVGKNTGLPVFTIPTIASTCAAMTSLSVVYTKEGDFDSFYFFEKPPIHCFIDCEIIAEAPMKYLRAGIGDTIAKHYECTLASRGDNVNHSSGLAIQISNMCVEPLLKYGEKALEDCSNNIDSFELQQVVLNNIVSTGLVSLLIDEKYNGAVAHSLFYGLTILEHIEKKYLHGDVVAYAVLVQLAVDNKEEELLKLYNFYKKVGIPTSLTDIEVKNNREKLEDVLQSTIDGPDMEYLPYVITKDMIFNGIQRVEGVSN